MCGIYTDNSTWNKEENEIKENVMLLIIHVLCLVSKYLRRMLDIFCVVRVYLNKLSKVIWESFAYRVPFTLFW